MGTASERQEGCLCLTKEVKRETVFFCTNTRDSSSRKERDTRSWKGILVSYFSSWQKQMELAQNHAADPFLGFSFSFFFFFFFPLFLCCGQDRWQARTKDNFPWTPCANRAVFLLESVYKTK